MSKTLGGRRDGAHLRIIVCQEHQVEDLDGEDKLNTKMSIMVAELTTQRLRRLARSMKSVTNYASRGKIPILTRYVFEIERFLKFNFQKN